MRSLLWILATYFLLSLVALVASVVDLPPYFYVLSFLILPLVLLGRLIEPVLSVLGLWSKAGAGGWISYQGPSFGGLLLIAIIGLIVAGTLLLRAHYQGK